MHIKREVEKEREVGVLAQVLIRMKRKREVEKEREVEVLAQVLAQTLAQVLVQALPQVLVQVLPHIEQMKLNKKLLRYKISEVKFRFLPSIYSIYSTKNRKRLNPDVSEFYI